MPKGPRGEKRPADVIGAAILGTWEYEGHDRWCRRYGERCQSAVQASPKMPLTARAMPQGMSHSDTKVECAPGAGLADNPRSALTFALVETVCLAGHIGFEPPNPAAGYLIGFACQLGLR